MALRDRIVDVRRVKGLAAAVKQRFPRVCESTVLALTMNPKLADVPTELVDRVRQVCGAGPEEELFIQYYSE